MKKNILLIAALMVAAPAVAQAVDSDASGEMSLIGLSDMWMLRRLTRCSPPRRAGIS